MLLKARGAGRAPRASDRAADDDLDSPRIERRRAASRPCRPGSSARGAAARPIRFSTGARLAKRFGGVIALGEVDLVVPRGAIIGSIESQRRRQDHVLQRRDGSHRAGRGPHRVRGREHSWGSAQRDRRARESQRTFQSIRLFPPVTRAETSSWASTVGFARASPAPCCDRRPSRRRGSRSGAARELLASSASTAGAGRGAPTCRTADQRRLRYARALGHRAAAFAARRADAGMNPRDREPDRH